MDITIDQVINYLRSALHHLYEPDQLRHSPLVPLLGIEGRGDASSALKDILVKAIEEIRPGEEESQHSQGWMVYEVLFFRYVQGYSREAVANQLGISDRQLSREQRTAMETLALHLWKSYHIEDISQAPSQAGGDDSGKPLAGEPAVHWTEALPTEKPAPWKPVLDSVMELLRPLIQENEVSLLYLPEDSLPDLLVPQVTLRHSLLTVLNWMIPLAHRSQLILTPSLREQSLILTAQIPGQSFPDDLSDSGIEAARLLIQRAGGSIEQAAGVQPDEPQPAEIRLILPTSAQITVLVIDDNPDTIQLFQRYVQGSRYTIVGLQRPTEAFRLIGTLNPRILLIDVMLPELDGWDLLTQLRLSYPMQNTAILICSILPQESLAHSLGADGFLQKPVLPQDFLNALDRQMDRLSQD
jgi:CheY-like chemotaxis protein/AraC-like DNA-binding protein